MLYLLHDDLAEEIRHPTPGLQDSLKLLLMHSINGQHLVLASRPIERAIHDWAQQFPSDARLRSAVNALSKQLKDASGYTKRLATRIELGPSWNNGWEENVYRLRLKDLQTPEQLRCATLVAEGQPDCDLYTRAAQAWHFKYTKSLLFTLQTINGKGAELAPTLRTQIQIGHPVFCWVDSDRDHANQTLSKACTAQIALNVIANTPGITKVYILPARDIENLLPEALLEQHFGGRQAMSRELGAKWHDWKRNHLLFPDNQNPYHDLKEELSDGIAETCASILKQMTEQKVAEILFSYPDKTWEAIGATTFAWACAGPRVAS